MGKGINRSGTKSLKMKKSLEFAGLSRRLFRVVKEKFTLPLFHFFGRNTALFS